MKTIKSDITPRRKVFFVNAEEKTLEEVREILMNLVEKHKEDLSEPSHIREENAAGFCQHCGSALYWDGMWPLTDAKCRQPECTFND